MLKKPVMTMLVAVALLALPLAAGAQSSTTLVEKYTPLAGSPDNAKALISGLRDGKDFKKMGNGEIDIALSLSEARLKQQGITNPTPEQLKSALTPILQQRADGKGWGEIAHSMGFKLGDVMRSEKAARHERMARTERPERHERPEKPERAERGGR
jgi:hypothetical protein